MKRKIIGIFIVTLLIATAVLPVVGTMNKGFFTFLNDREDTDQEQGSAVGLYDDLDWKRSNENMYSGHQNSDGYPTGNVGIGTNNPIGKLHVKESDVSNTALFERSERQDDVPWTTMRLLATRSNNMKNGFGSALNFCIQDDAGIINIIGHIWAERNGDDTTGDIYLVPMDSGNKVETLVVSHTGNVGIGVTNPTSKLHIGGIDGVDGICFPDGTIQTTAFTSTGGGNDDHDWKGAGSGQMSTEHASDFVGIGTPTPDRKLEVHDELYPYVRLSSPVDINVNMGIEFFREGDGNDDWMIKSKFEGGFDIGWSGDDFRDFTEVVTLEKGDEHFHNNLVLPRGDLIVNDPFSNDRYLFGYDTKLGAMVIKKEHDSVVPFSVSSNVNIANNCIIGSKWSLGPTSSSSNFCIHDTNPSTPAYLVCDEGTGNVGIGVDVPEEKLHVDGAIRLTGGSDIAEPFSVNDKDRVEPGMVVVIDTQNPGDLKLSDTPYDHCVAGIISGAGGIKPGLTLTQDDVFDEGYNVALAGRVYGCCDATYGSIQPGDLLTTSSTPGYAMKVTDYAKAQGAILGKAMTGLDEGTGLVLILVSLQ